jgi:16S rRNA (cytidine1402-2'-O)-methyltransferase
VLPRLVAGETVALVSDAGLPGINDPGMRLVAAARDAVLPVTVLPGASAVATALVASGFASERYQFLGYLPRGERALIGLWEELASWPHAAIAFESPQRLPTALRTLAATMPDRPLAVCRELTKAFEEVFRGPAQDVAARFDSPPKGEVTLVLGPASPRDLPEQAAVEAVVELMTAGMTRRSAVDLVSRATGVPRNRLYERSL